MRTVVGERTVPNADEELARLKAWAPYAALFAPLGERARADAWAAVRARWTPYERPDGGCTFPLEILVFGATRRA
jgi:hypothetical protein